MKNVFRFLGIALVAGSMLASCSGTDTFTIKATANDAAMGTVTGGGNYEENATATLTATAKDGYMFVNWNDGVTENPRTITVTADAEYVANFAAAATEGMNVTFGTTSWTAGAMSVKNYTSYGIWQATGMQDASGNSYPIMDMAIAASATGNYTDNTADGQSYANSIVNWCEYYEESALQDQNSNTYGDWWAKNATINVTNFDATAGKIAANVSGELFSAMEAFVDGAGFDGASVRNFTCNFATSSMAAAKGAIVRK